MMLEHEVYFLESDIGTDEQAEQPDYLTEGQPPLHVSLQLSCPRRQLSCHCRQIQLCNHTLSYPFLQANLLIKPPQAPLQVSIYAKEHEFYMDVMDAAISYKFCAT
eukprot:1153701-Pelagomonas_calceolata.AAC.1